MRWLRTPPPLQARALGHRDGPGVLSHRIPGHPDNAGRLVDIGDGDRQDLVTAEAAGVRDPHRDLENARNTGSPIA